MNVCIRTRNPIRWLLSGILEAKLDVVKACLHQASQPCFRNSNSRSDEIGVETHLAGGGNQFVQVRSSRRFAAGQMQLQDSKMRRLFDKF